MLNALQRLGHNTLTTLGYLGDASAFLVRVLLRLPSRVGEALQDFVRQVYSVGVYSLPIVIVSGVFIGLVVGLQGEHTLSQFGASSALGQLVALSVVRELGPVVTGLLFAGRACSALTAEIGLMKATEQLSSMEMMGVDPLGRIVAPRFWAGLFSMPLLVIIFDAFAIWGGYLISVKVLGIDGGTFWNNMQAGVNFHTDVLNGIYKAIVFGVVATWVAVYQGYACVPTAEGISRATTRTVVYASLAVLGLDFILTALMMGGW
jgi:phospholipid/cholesterol/gamma-HCH transport system permease protein